ncbi:hypothetical protein SCHPADRAFT_944879 [Schizopora paradoxa]|uniref:Uncharacterized protein n=1 Tax=Schizopora paradoxa TaxID=27342 RepID=A0A0H2R7Y6_9AGAM|nr:hypothetical protein SCHPADRAFT_944879 [Schizopora paradoxa]
MSETVFEYKEKEVVNEVNARGRPNSVHVSSNPTWQWHLFPVDSDNLRSPVFDTFGPQDRLKSGNNTNPSRGVNFNVIHEAQRNASTSSSLSDSPRYHSCDWPSLSRAFDNAASSLMMNIVKFENHARTLPPNSTVILLCRELCGTTIPRLSNINFQIAVDTRRSVGAELATAGSEYLYRLKCGLNEMSRVLNMIDGSSISHQYAKSGLLNRQDDAATVGYAEPIDKLRFNSSPDYRGQLLDDCIQNMRSLSFKLESPQLVRGLDRILVNQDYFRNAFMNSSTIAIFFSSITATTLQFSYLSSGAEGVSWTIVNACWFASLVLSIASATNGFLGAVVHQSPEYLGRANNLEDHLLQMWFRVCPSLLLTFAGALYLAGLCAFAISSSQEPLTKIVTIVLTAANSVALLTIYLMVFSRRFRQAIRFFPRGLLMSIVVPPTVTALAFCVLFKRIASSLGVSELPLIFYDLLKFLNMLLDRVGSGEAIRRWMFGARTASDQFERELDSQV